MSHPMFNLVYNTDGTLRQTQTNVNNQNLKQVPDAGLGPLYLGIVCILDIS